MILMKLLQIFNQLKLYFDAMIVLLKEKEPLGSQQPRWDFLKEGQKAIY